MAALTSGASCVFRVTKDFQFSGIHGPVVDCMTVPVICTEDSLIHVLFDVLHIIHNVSFYLFCSHFQGRFVPGGVEQHPTRVLPL